jgi:hypothetical protein
MNKEKNIDFFITKNDGSREKFTIDSKGSLGILALGAVGIRAWKEVRAIARKENKTKNEEKK